MCTVVPVCSMFHTLLARHVVPIPSFMCSSLLMVAVPMSCVFRSVHLSCERLDYLCDCRTVANFAILSLDLFLTFSASILVQFTCYPYVFTSNLFSLLVCLCHASPHILCGSAKFSLFNHISVVFGVIQPSRSFCSFSCRFFCRLGCSFFDLGHFVCHLGLHRSFSDNFVCST
jgi:hypothetical protein